MTLTLKIRNIDRLDNGMPTEMVLHQRGALIGRAPTCDWSLPDPRNFISSRHCEVSFASGFYILRDVSMNGTFLNGSAERMTDPRRIEPGDIFAIGQYEVAAMLTGDAIVAIERDVEQGEARREGNWGGWESHGGGKTPPTSGLPEDDGWGVPVGGVGGDGWNSAPLPPASDNGWQPRTGPSLAREQPHRQSGNFSAPPPSSPAGGWAPAVANVPLPPVASTWEPHIEKADPASGWSSAAPDRPSAASPDDIWGRIADGNVVDWARGGFGQPIEEQRDPLGLNKPSPQASLNKAPPQMAKVDNSGWGPARETAPPTGSTPSPADTPPALASTKPSSHAAVKAPLQSAGSPSEVTMQTLVQAMGLAPDQVKDLSPAMLDRAGQLFHRLVAGLVVMVEARARAKSQMGAEATAFEFDGNNPIKFARTPEEAIAALLNPPERGFMEAGRAIEDAYFDLQSHQMATLKAMQGALRATLDRFSPEAIKKRAETGGLLTKIIPAARDAALWQAYEKEFGGVSQGSDEAFMDVFAKEFRRAYDEQSWSQKKRRG